MTYLCVLQFLEKSGFPQLCRENFTFSTKVNIGRFYEQRPTSDEVRKLSCINYMYFFLHKQPWLSGLGQWYGLLRLEKP